MRTLYLSQNSIRRRVLFHIVNIICILAYSLVYIIFSLLLFTFKNYYLVINIFKINYFQKKIIIN